MDNRRIACRNARGCASFRARLRMSATSFYKRSNFVTHLPVDCLYSPSHFWLREIAPGRWRVGFTKFATRMLGEIVTADLRAAAVMERFGLDYCCGGQRSLGDACQAKSIPIDQVLSALGALGPAAATDQLPAEWRELDALTR